MTEIITAASGQVWSLISGLPRAKREARTFMILHNQAWVDDSGSDPQDTYFVLAGFVAQANQWIPFSDEWQVVLDQSPKLDYLKMSEAASLGAHGQFARSRGWTEAKRDKRVADFVDVIKKYAAIRIHASIKNSEFNTYLKSLPAVTRSLTTDHPYIILAQQLILWTAMCQDQHGVIEPCDFIFDEQLGVSVEMAEMWPGFSMAVKTQSKSDLGKFIGSQPTYRDDECFLPLQAADLYAWQIRRFHIDSDRTLWVPIRKVMKQLDVIPWIARDIRKSELVKLNKLYLEMGQRMAAMFPSVKLVAASRQERRKARSAKRRAKKASS